MIRPSGKQTAPVTHHPSCAWAQAGIIAMKGDVVKICHHQAKPPKSQTSIPQPTGTNFKALGTTCFTLASWTRTHVHHWEATLGIRQIPVANSGAQSRPAARMAFDTS